MVDEVSANPTVMMGAIMRYICQYPNSPTKSRAVRREAREAKSDRTKRELVMLKVDEKPLKQLSQKVPKRMLVCAAIEITNSSETYVKSESLRKGEYSSVNASSRLPQLETREKSELASRVD